MKSRAMVDAAPVVSSVNFVSRFGSRTASNGKSLFRRLYVRPLHSISVSLGTGNLCSALVRLQEQGPISLKGMSTLGFYRCQKIYIYIFMLSRWDDEVCWVRARGASGSVPAGHLFYSEIQKEDAGSSYQALTSSGSQWVLCKIEEGFGIIQNRRVFYSWENRYPADLWGPSV